MGLISIGGLGSGMDVTGIVEALVNAEKAPKENTLNRQEVGISVAITGLGGLSSSLDEVRSAALDLSLASNFNKRKVTTTSSEFFSATATTSSTLGNYDIEVTSLARGSFDRTEVFSGGSTTTFGTGGTLTIGNGTDSFDIVVSASDTLDDIRTNINAAAENTFVTVNILNNVTEATVTGSVLTFDTTTLGAGNDLVITATGDALLNDLTTADAEMAANNIAATDAGIKIDGLEATSTSNSFSDIIEGVTINVKKIQTTSGDTGALTIALDTDSTKNLITNFVETFNAFVAVTKELGSADTAAPGLLLGDYTLRNVTSQIRNLFSTSVSAVTGSFNNLSSIGISTTQTGTLEINNTTLDTALASDFDQFDELFSGDKGFATELRSLIDSYTGSDGIITSRETSLDAQLRRVADERIELGLRIEKLQFRLTTQFSTMDTIVAQMNSTQSYIAQQFENLPGFGSSKK